MTIGDTVEIPQIYTIEWDMMDRNKFLPLSVISNFSIRCVLYPFAVIKTRIQVQKHKTIYKGTLDAFRKILHFEGVPGLYKGFWVSTVQIAASVIYITTYENVRHLMATRTNVQSSKLKALVAGGCASVIGQTIVVPFDILSQHMMVLGQHVHRSDGKVASQQAQSIMNPLNIVFDSKNKSMVTLAIVKELHRRDGLRGFYRGYLASLCTYVPSSALWWCFYHFYSDHIVMLAPIWTPHLLIQCVAAPLGGITASLLTNPLDIVRARLQVQRLDSIGGTFRLLWQEEKMAIFVKGLSARMIQSVIYSCMIILGYETIKRWSVREEYRDYIRW